MLLAVAPMAEVWMMHTWRGPSGKYYTSWELSTARRQTDDLIEKKYIVP